MVALQKVVYKLLIVLSPSVSQNSSYYKFKTVPSRLFVALKESVEEFIHKVSYLWTNENAFFQFQSGGAVLTHVSLPKWLFYALSHTSSIMKTRAKNWILRPYLVSPCWTEEESTILVKDTFCMLTSVIIVTKHWLQMIRNVEVEWLYEVFYRRKSLLWL